MLRAGPHGRPACGEDLVSSSSQFLSGGRPALHGASPLSHLVAEFRPGPYTITASITALPTLAGQLLVPLPEEDVPLAIRRATLRMMLS